MSIAEFSDALKSTALKNWFQRLSTDNILKISAKDLRKKESGKEYNSFYITEKTVSDVIAKLTGTTATKEDVAVVINKFKNAVYGRNNKALEISEPYVEGSALYYPRVSFDTIGTILDEGFSDVLVKARNINPDVKISDFFQRGHVFGIFPKKLALVSKSLQGNTTLSETSKALLLGVLKDLESSLRQEDLETSNLKSPAFGLYASYEKKASKYLVELQLKTENEAAGRKQASLSKAIRKYLNPGSVTFTANGGIKFTEGEAETYIKTTILNNVEKLLGSKGSPSVIELLQAQIRDAIIGKKHIEKVYIQKNVPIIKSKSAKIDLTSINRKVKQDLVGVQKLIKSIKAVPKLDIAPQQTSQVNLSTLMRLINSQLQHVIAANMGDGSETKVLNYRTGRFAASAAVERMSESRAGMITAWYTYQNNPYQTFAPGFAQGNIPTRNPNLLIGKSIREIAATKVGNNLRAIKI